MFVLRNNGRYYLAKKIQKIGIGWTNKIIRRATEDEIKLYHQLLNHNSATVYMICDNPYCDEKVRTTRSQKIKFNTEDPIKGRLEFIYCSKKCREEHLEALTKK